MGNRRARPLEYSWWVGWIGGKTGPLACVCMLVGTPVWALGWVASSGQAALQDAEAKVMPSNAGTVGGYDRASDAGRHLNEDAGPPAARCGLRVAPSVSRCGFWGIQMPLRGGLLPARCSFQGNQMRARCGLEGSQMRGRGWALAARCG